MKGSGAGLNQETMNVTLTKECRRTLQSALILAALLLAGCILLTITTSCNGEPQNNNKPTEPVPAAQDTQRKKTRQERIRKEADKISSITQHAPAVAQMVSKYQAVPHWEGDVKEPGRVFAINMQEAMVRSDNRPILLINRIDDLVKEGNKYYLNFESITYTHDVYFTLECDAEQANELLGQTSSPDDEYAMIAHVSSVRKLKFNISAAPKSIEEAEIELDTSDAFTAEGKCLALLKVEHVP
jgi:hypothetical protein